MNQDKYELIYKDTIFDRRVGIDTLAKLTMLYEFLYDRIPKTVDWNRISYELTKKHCRVEVLNHLLSLDTIDKTQRAKLAKESKVLAKEIDKLVNELDNIGLRMIDSAPLFDRDNLDKVAQSIKTIGDRLNSSTWYMTDSSEN